MFKVRNKNINNSDEIIDSYTVYNIRNDSTGYPMFLIYKDNQWIWISAKYFKPID